MWTKTASAQEILALANRLGCVGISGGWLQTAADLQNEQPDWADDDGAKNVNFAQAPYWIVTTDGHLAPIQDAEDLMEHVELYHYRYIEDDWGEWDCWAPTVEIAALMLEHDVREAFGNEIEIHCHDDVGYWQGRPVLERD